MNQTMDLIRLAREAVANHADLVACDPAAKSRSRQHQRHGQRAPGASRSLPRRRGRRLGVGVAHLFLEQAQGAGTLRQCAIDGHSRQHAFAVGGIELVIDEGIQLLVGYLVLHFTLRSGVAESTRSKSSRRARRARCRRLITVPMGMARISPTSA